MGGAEARGKLGVNDCLIHVLVVYRYRYRCSCSRASPEILVLSHGHLSTKIFF